MKYKITFVDQNGPQSIIPHGPVGRRLGEVEVVTVTLNLKKLDDQWSKDHFAYSGKGGSDRKEDKINGVGSWLKQNESLWRPVIYITNDDPSSLFFADGRHTTAFLFESGYQDAEFNVPKHQAEIIKLAYS